MKNVNTTFKKIKHQNGIKLFSSARLFSCVYFVKSSIRVAIMFNIDLFYTGQGQLSLEGAWWHHRLGAMNSLS